MSMPDYYWLKHIKHVSANRLVWNAEEPDEKFWDAHWRQRVTPAYFMEAAAIKLQDDETGRVLLKYISKQGTHLEAGCGAGYWVAALTGHGYRVDGIEYAEDLVKLVRLTAPSLSVRFGDALNIGVGDETYDSYLSFGVVEHRRDGPLPFLREARRVIRPGGVICISVPFFGPIRRCKARCGFYQKDAPGRTFFQYAFTASEFSAFLKEAGFEEPKVYPLFPHRLLIEESWIYRKLVYLRGGRLIKQFFSNLVAGRDGHMALFVAKRGN